MNTSDQGIAFIKSFEKCRLVPYQDSAGVWTIGWGHAMRRDEDYDTMTNDKADALFLEDLATVEDEINVLLEIDLSQNQYDALASFTFNEGSGNLAKSTLLKLINTGDMANAAMQFIRWDFAGGEQSAGLMARRVAEKQIFETGRYSDHA